MYAFLSALRAASQATVSIAGIGGRNSTVGACIPLELDFKRLVYTAVLK